MSNKNINIVNRKKTNINNKEMKNSLIAMFLLPSLVLKDDNENPESPTNSYSFLENESNGLLYKFKKSMPYFKKLKEEFIDKNFIVESDSFFEINSIDLFALQTITEFANNKFTYKTDKNYYKALLENTEFFELSEKIILLNKYINSLSSLFNIIESNLFDLSSGMTISLNEYVSKFEKDRIVISDLLFGRNIKLQDLIKKIKVSSYENDKRLIEKVKQLELDYDNDGFLYKDDFLKFLYYIMEEIKILFSSIIDELIPAIDELWKSHEILLEENKAEEKARIENENSKKNIESKNNEMIIEEFDESNVESKDQMIIEEFDESIIETKNNDLDIEFSNDEIVSKENSTSKIEDECIEWIEKDECENNKDISENEKKSNDDSFNEEDLELWNTMVDVNDDDFESKKNECDENNFISETEDAIYKTLVEEINGLDNNHENNDIENVEDEEEAITKNMDSLINEIKDSIEKEDNSNEEFEY